MKKRTFWICCGDVRGDCGHKHLSLETAERCLLRDKDGCADQGGYSDRVILEQWGTQTDAITVKTVEII